MKKNVTKENYKNANRKCYIESWEKKEIWIMISDCLIRGIHVLI